MPDDISASGWLVILGALALGFGVVRFIVSTMADTAARQAQQPPRPPPQPPPDGDAAPTDVNDKH